MMRPAHPGFMALSIVVIALDQWTKFLAVSELAEGSIQVTSFFNLVLVYNTGAAFGFLNSAGGWQSYLFLGIAALVTGWILTMLWRGNNATQWFPFGLSMILAGAVGNALDRIFRYGVVDFLDFHYLQMHWPAFNVADISIFIGVFAIVLDAVTGAGRDRQ